MRGMAYQVTAFPPSIESIKCTEGSFGSNNSNEPISVLDTRRSPSPSTSTSTLSSSFGGGGNGSTTTTTGSGGSPPVMGASETNDNLQQKWPDSVPPEMGVSISGSATNLVGGGGGGCRKDEWPELQPIPAGFELQQHRFGVGLDDWESFLSESAVSPSQDQSLLRWISGDIDDPSFSLKQLLQGNQIDENVAATGVFDASSNNVSLNPLSSSNINLQNPSFFPFSFPDQKPQIFNPPLVLNPPPTPQIQFHHHQGFQKPPDLDPGHEFLLKKQNQQQLPHQQKPLMVAAAKQEPPPALPQHLNQNHHHQNQLICDQLFAAAELILSGNFSHAQGILARLNHQLPSSAMAPNKPFQRAAFYFKEALQMAFLLLNSNSNPNSVITHLPQRIIPTPFNGMFKMGAYKVLSEVSPIVQFMNFTANQTLLEALGDAENIHIIDFDIGFGAQWSSFIQELPRRKNGGGSLKITAFASPSTHHPIELGLMHENLSQFAQEIGISFQLEVVNFDSFDPSSFSVSGNEAIAVNFPIWSTSTHLSAIPSLLHFIKQLSPKVVVALDRGCERTDLPFPQYLLQGLQYYEVLLDSIDSANVGSDTANKIEKFLFQPQIESMVMGKLQIPEPMPHWKTLFTAGGYSPVLLSNFAEAQADCVVKRTQVRGFHVEKRQASLVLCWQNRELMAASAWKC